MPDQPDLLDIGEYARDVRLFQHTADHASFYGERANPVVAVERWTRTFHAAQREIPVGYPPDRLPAAIRDACGATAAEALAQLIGAPILPGDPASVKELA